MKPILLSEHAKSQMTFRGTTETEIFETIQTSSWTAAKGNRLECRKDFPFNAAWNEKPYKIKQVRPIFVDEPGEIVVITVYVYFIA